MKKSFLRRINNRFTLPLLIFINLIMISAGETPYKTFSNDPAGVRMYTLPNGLTVYLAKNQDEPKIQTYIAVRAGSVYDPKDNTGLAHYLEHMLFKGTSKLGTTDWEKESKLLDEISALYEMHKATSDPAKKAEIYQQIDKLSGEAAQYAVANEYDQIIAGLGGQKTNAHTWLEETIYKNMIPTSSLEKWLSVESERFGELVLRLFHTELETVYEEFNRGQDNDGREQFEKMLENLFPTHPYGQQTTIGTAEHLKNPSMVAIHNYFKKYYVPNNIAIVLVGDIEFEPTIALVEKYFGKLKPQALDRPKLPTEQPMTSPVVATVTGPSPESVLFGFRTAGVGSKDELYASIVTMLLYNGSAGLIDIELNQKQKLQGAYAQFFAQNDYGVHLFGGMPKNNQTLDEVRDLLLGEIDKVKQGNFPDWMLQAIINNLKLAEVRKFENATSLADELYESYIHFQSWQNRVNFVEELSKVSKKDIVDFASRTYNNNYSLIYKKQGQNDYAIKVDKPNITPIKLRENVSSTFSKALANIPEGKTSPLFVDYKSEIQKIQADKNLQVYAVKNKNNDLFTLSYVFDMGIHHIKDLSVAVDYFDLLGTDQYSPEAIKQEFYKLATELTVNVSERRTTISLSGLYGDNFETAVKLLDHYISHLKADKAVYDELVDRIAKDRENEKGSKKSILFNGLYNLGIYGENSPLKDRYSIAELKTINPQRFVDLIKKLPSYQHEIFYYGTHSDEVASILKQHHAVSSKPLAYPAPKAYKMISPNKTVYVTDFDMVQGEILFLSKDGTFDTKNLALIDLFNNYFGSGLSSVVFREIRESQALAYAASSRYRLATYKDQENVLFGYLGTQVDKLPQAVDALNKLLAKMPEANDFFESARQSSLKEIESDRITKTGIIYSYLRLRDLGIDYDIRKDVYELLKKTSIQDLSNFFNTHIAKKTYNFAVIGNVKNLNMEALKKLGTVQEVSVDYLFDPTTSSK